MRQLQKVKKWLSCLQRFSTAKNLLSVVNCRQVNQNTFKTCAALRVIELMSNTDPALAALNYRVIKVMENLRGLGQEIPDRLSENDWHELLKKLRQLGTTKRIMEVVVEQYFADLAEQKNFDPEDIVHNSFLRHYDNDDLERLYTNRLSHAVCYGQDLVIDVNYCDYMTKKDMVSLVRQIAVLYNANKLDKDPFHLHLCNIKPGDGLLQELKEAVPALAKSNPLVTITEKNYLDLFPKERLVLMTPDTTEDLAEFNHEDIYIIGGMVTKGWDVPATFPKAQQEGIRARRLPLDKYLFWGVGRKALTLYTVMNVLLSLKNQAEWKKALEHIPPLCLFWHPPGSSHQSRHTSMEEAIWPSCQRQDEDKQQDFT